MKRLLVLAAILTLSLTPATALQPPGRPSDPADPGRPAASQSGLQLDALDKTADATNFNQRAMCVADQYSSYTVTGDTHINGRLTLGENTADNGGTVSR